MIRRSWVAALVASVCALGAPVVAGAGVEIRSVDTGSYPRAQATIVTSKPSKEAPQLTEGGKPAAGVLAKNLGESRSICLAVDHSRSMRGVPLTEAVVAARAFVAAKLPTDRICVTSFATKELLLAPFTDSEAEASAALESIKVDPDKGTALYDDVRLASQTLAEEEGRARIIILVTDGNETLSSATLADAIKGAQEAETTVYVVAIESKAFTPGPLKYLAKRTGGRYYGAPSPGALQGIYAELAAELKRTWRLDYVTSGRPGESPKLVAYVPGLGRDSARSPIAATAEVAKPGGLLPAAAYGKGWVHRARPARGAAHPARRGTRVYVRQRRSCQGPGEEAHRAEAEAIEEEQAKEGAPAGTRRALPADRAGPRRDAHVAQAQPADRARRPSAQDRSSSST